jgi:hypothetical protein
MAAANAVLAKFASICPRDGSLETPLMNFVRLCMCARGWAWSIGLPAGSICAAAVIGDARARGAVLVTLERDAPDLFRLLQDKYSISLARDPRFAAVSSQARSRLPER